MLTYCVTHPKMLHDGKAIMGAPLYSGRGPGLNNPALEAMEGFGPIPAGQWKIVRWDEHHPGFSGPVAILEPVGHDAHGRTGFLIHGPHENDHFDSSKGCIVAGLALRQSIRETGDMNLEVVP